MLVFLCVVVFLLNVTYSVDCDSLIILKSFNSCNELCYGLHFVLLSSSSMECIYPMHM